MESHKIYKNSEDGALQCLKDIYIGELPLCKPSITQEDIGHWCISWSNRLHIDIKMAGYYIKGSIFNDISKTNSYHEQFNG